MDKKILRQIFESSESVKKDLEKKRDIENVVEGFPVLDQVAVSALATSLSKLLTYKVSKDAYQRYSARIQVIEVLREWVRPPAGLDTQPTFNQGEKMSEFIHTLMKKYLGSHILQNENLTNSNLVKLGKFLFNLSKQNSIYVPHLKAFIQGVGSSNFSCNEADEFIGGILDSRNELNLETHLIDKLYILNARKFIEIPLIDNFLMNYERLKGNEELLTSDDFYKTIKLIASSSKLFQIASSILKDTFINLDYSSLVIKYIQFVLKIIHRSNNNQIVKLYPTHLQSYVILMRLDSNYQTENSKKYIFNKLSELYFKNRDEVFILILHYPDWLEELSLHVSDLI